MSCLTARGVRLSPQDFSRGKVSRSTKTTSSPCSAAQYAALGAGLLAWTLGAPNSVHVGASGVIFGYLGFLLLSGWYSRSFMSIVMSLGVAALWGGTVMQVLPGAPGISWQGHLGGFIGGILAARKFRVSR